MSSSRRKTSTPKSGLKPPVVRHRRKTYADSKRDTGQGDADVAMAAPSRAKLFQNGRSQAVRLPKAFRFDGTEVQIERKGLSVVLTPVMDAAARKLHEEERWRYLDAMQAKFGDFPDVEEDLPAAMESIFPEGW